MSVKVMDMVFNSELQGGRKLLMLTLASYASDDGRNVYPSIDTLTDKAGLSKTTVMKWLRVLCEEGLLMFVRRRGNAQNEYRICIQALAELQQKEACTEFVEVVEEETDVRNPHLRRSESAPQTFGIRTSDVRNPHLRRSESEPKRLERGKLTRQLTVRQKQLRARARGEACGAKPEAAAAGGQEKEFDFIKPNTEPETKPLPEQEAEPGGVYRGGTGPAMRAYESGIGMLTPLVVERIKAVVEEDKVPVGWVVDAIGEAEVHNARSWAYVEKILARWLREGRGEKSGRAERAKFSTIGREPPEPIPEIVMSAQEMADARALAGF